MRASCRDDLIRELADGEIHSGSALAKKFGRSRTAVWKQLHQLEELGLDVESLPGKGYRLQNKMELLDAGRIEQLLDAKTSASLASIEVHSVIPSTNDRLRAASPPTAGYLRAALAEYQTGGRGRRGRQWLSPFGSGVCLSVSWRYEVVPPSFPALGLAVGFGAQRALTQAGAGELQLKWPNDIIAGSGKLAGLLLDVEGESTGPLDVVVGIGVNIDVSPELTSGVARTEGLPPVGMRQLVVGGKLSRNRIAAMLIAEFRKVLADFSEMGFSGFADDWRRHDYLFGRKIQVQSGGRMHCGVAAGIGPDGALLVDAGGKLQSIMSGEVSVREIP